MKKRLVSLISVILSALMLVSVFSVITVSAAETKLDITTALNGSSIKTVSVEDDTVTISYFLKSPMLIEDAQATLYYDSDKLRIKSFSCPNAAIAILNKSVPGEAYLNFTGIRMDQETGKGSGMFDFKEKKVLVTAKFEIIGSGSASINLDVEELDGLENDFQEHYYTRSVPADSASEITAVLADPLLIIGEEETTAVTEPATEAPTQPGETGLNLTTALNGTLLKTTKVESETVTVTYFLKAPMFIEDAQATLYFDSNKLSIVSLSSPNVPQAVINKKGDGGAHINFTGINVDPDTGKGSGRFDFRESKVFLTAKFNVIGTGSTTVNLDMEELDGLENDVHYDYYTRGAASDSASDIIKSLSNPVVSVEEAATFAEETTIADEDSSKAEEETSPATYEPTTDFAQEEPTEPMDETKESGEPGEPAQEIEGTEAENVEPETENGEPETEGTGTEVSEETFAPTEFTAPVTEAPESVPANVKINYVFNNGDIINFGQGNYYILLDDEANEMVEVSGSYALKYMSYYEDYGQQSFELVSDSVTHTMFILDGKTSKPSGIKIKGGDGSYANPFTFATVYKTASANAQPTGKPNSATKPTSKPSNTSKTDISKWKVVGIKNKTYSGKKITQNVMVTNGKVLATFKVRYKDNNKPGKAVMMIYGTGKYSGYIVKTFTIYKKKQPAKISVSDKTVKVKKLKKKAVVISPVKIKNAKGKVTFTKDKSNSTKFSGKITINKKNGKFKLKKGKYSKGTFKVTVVIKIAGNSIYKSKRFKKVVKVRIK